MIPTLSEKEILAALNFVAINADASKWRPIIEDARAVIAAEREKIAGWADTMPTSEPMRELARLLRRKR